MDKPKGYTYKENTPGQQENEKKARIVFLNDQLRETGQGGQIIATQGIATLPQETQLALSQAIQDFSNFSEENDPYGEHDFGSVEVAGHTIFWKIDYFAQDMMHLSPDKSDTNLTNRVMTIMLASEY